MQHQIWLEFCECLAHGSAIAHIQISQPSAFIVFNLNIGCQDLREALLEVRINRVAEHAAAAGNQNFFVGHN